VNVEMSAHCYLRVNKFIQKKAVALLELDLSSNLQAQKLYLKILRSISKHENLQLLNLSNCPLIPMEDQNQFTYKKKYLNNSNVNENLKPNLKRIAEKAKEDGTPFLVSDLERKNFVKYDGKMLNDVYKQYFNPNGGGDVPVMKEQANDEDQLKVSEIKLLRCLSKVIVDSPKLQHLNLSNVGLRSQMIIEIFVLIKKSKKLESIHLGNNPGTAPVV
jgi:hypothetical protein